MADAYHRASYQRVRPLILEAAGYRCQWPGCTNPATTVDHVTPLAHGGTNHPSNLRASCQACNSRGGMKIVNEMRLARRLGARSRTW
jgi:5-methylcytosine-specific restriction endonuclease McrA